MRFTQFNFHPHIHAGIRSAGYTDATPIQEKTIPMIIEGQDVLGLAQTGTGKTAAFVLPILQHLHNLRVEKISAQPQALIMVPTRELAEQIYENIKKLAAYTTIKSLAVYGGVKKTPQIKTLRSGVDIVVACPGRLMDLLNEKALTLKNVKTLVLDEADRMLDMGFMPDIRRIIRYLPENRQSLVFSATMPRQIEHLVQTMLHQPVKIQINHKQPSPSIRHSWIAVQKEERTTLLKKLFSGTEMTSTLVFTRTKHKAKSLACQLKKSGYSAASLQGNLSQNQRKKAMDGFRDGSFKILVATDIAARGIDVSGVSHVINYDLPDTVETYIHRTGRTGRADQFGQAYTFVGPSDDKMIAMIERNLGQKMKNQSKLCWDTPNRNNLRKAGLWQSKRNISSKNAKKNC
ncbi:DEAD/DEAH box helicase [Desulfobacter curvatus]|uniref:DEAD/DEAH box helicase n=1 Tax=Desulfobacter curvatus TaxID=2290 RepID=UPI0003747B1E|nr:DEAD/DEAH box helicase [Desulfobacter curvatus]